MPPINAYGALIGLIGSIIMPHNLFLHSSLIKEKNYQGNKLDVFKNTSIETLISLIFSFLINGALISTFAAFSNNSVDVTLSNAGIVMEKNFHGYANIIWGVGLLASG